LNKFLEIHVIENWYILSIKIHSIFLYFQRTDSTSKKPEGNRNSKKNRSSPDDDDGGEENQVNKPLLHSLPKTEIKQPKKKVIVILFPFYRLISLSEND
jgi:hypothetical protein